MQAVSAGQTSIAATTRSASWWLCDVDSASTRAWHGSSASLAHAPIHCVQFAHVPGSSEGFGLQDVQRRHLLPHAQDGAASPTAFLVQATMPLRLPAERLGSPDTREDHGDVDVQLACRRFAELHSLVVGRQIVPVERLALEINKAEQGKTRRSGVAAYVPWQSRNAMIAQGQRIDLARIVFSAEQTLREFAPPSLQCVRLVFSAHEIDDFVELLRQALSLRIDLSSRQGLTVYEYLAGLDEGRHRSAPYVWRFAWQASADGPLEVCRLLPHRSSISLHVEADGECEFGASPSVVGS